jgi:16S rRNA (cytosine967-C5)-methyltransferase
MSARDIARRVLDRVDKGGAWATLALDAELARSGLDDRDRRLASELVYGVLRNRARIDRALGAHADLSRTPPKVRTALRIAAYQVLFLDRVPAYAAVDDAVAAARGFGGQKLAGFANAVLRKLTNAKEPAFPADPMARIEIEYSMPRWILDELAAAISGAT